MQADEGIELKLLPDGRWRAEIASLGCWAVAADPWSAAADLKAQLQRRHNSKLN